MGWESGNIAFKFLGAYMAGCVCGSHFVHIYMAVLGVTVAVHLLFFSYFASMKILALILCTIHITSI